MTTELISPSSHELPVTFIDMPEPEHPPPAVFRRLVRAMFRHDDNVEQVIISALPGGHIGLSSMTITLAQPLGRQGVEQNLLLLRMGASAAIAQERANYERYIRGFTGTNLVQPRHYAEPDSGYAAIGYDYRNEPGSRKPLHTLRDFLWGEYGVETANRAINTLVDMLTQINRRNRWYNDARLHPAQRPLWFYNQILPPVVTLADVRLGPHDPALPALLSLLSQADQPGAEALHGQQVALATTAQYPHLRVVERNDTTGVARLYLYEGAPPDPQEQYPPFTPVAARIELRLSTEQLAALPDTLDDRVLRGRVVQTRYTTLMEHLARLRALRERFPDGIIFESTRWDNPLSHYGALLSEPRPLHTSIIHGDMNLGNILLSCPDAQRSDATPWLIDFDRTGPGGHTVFDVVKLETEYKIHLLPHRLRLDELITLERALNQSLINPDQELPLGESRRLREAYQFIANLRRIALSRLAPGGTRIRPAEYLLGLLAYGVTALKYANLYGEHRDCWLTSSPHIDPLATAAYVSAAAACYALRTYGDLTLRERSYAPLPSIALPQRPLRPPRLIGRESVLSAARARLAPDQPAPRVVLLHGSSASGRSAVAATLCADLQGANHLVLPEVRDETALRTVDDLLKYLEGTLHRLGIIKRSQHIIQPPRKGKQRGKRQEQLWDMRERLLDVLEQSAHPIVLWLRLDQADAELRGFVGELATAVERTALVVLAPHPLDELRKALNLEITPWSREDLARYVRSEQLPLDNRAVHRLHDASLGYPALVMLLLNRVRDHTPETMQTAVLALDVAGSQQEFIAAQWSRLSAPQRWLLGLDALLSEHTPTLLASIESIFAALARKLKWAAAPDLPALHDFYRQHRRQQGFADLLRPLALQELRAAADYPRVCAQLADHCARAAPRNSLPLEAFYAAEAQLWERAAGLLQTLASERQREIYRQHAAIIHAAADAVALSGAGDTDMLYELAADYAALSGNYRAAAERYALLVTRCMPAEPRRLRFQFLELKMHDARGDQDAAARAASALARYAAAGEPFAALGLAYQGVTLLGTDLGGAAAQLQKAIDILDHSRARWGDEQVFLETELNVLYGYLAQAQGLQGHYDEAIALLQTAREVAHRTLKDRALTARADSYLGSFYYHRGRDNDIELARNAHKAALDTRQQIGDLVGEMRSAQNLAVVLVETAANPHDWQEAERRYRQAERAARRVDADDRMLLVGNRMELLIRQGEFDQARQLFAQAITEPRIDEDSRALLLTNRAVIDMWTGEREQCAARLDQVRQLVAAQGNKPNSIEWLLRSVESHLLLGIPADQALIAGQLAATQPADADHQPADMAFWSLARGLLDFSAGEAARALKQIERSQAIWQRISFQYLAGYAAWWRAHIAVEVQSPVARDAIADAERLLAWFGDTPVLGRVRALQRGA